MLLSVLLAVAAVQAAADGDVLSPARQGMVRCVAPNRIRKTCATLTAFTVRPDGSFDADVTGVGVQGTAITVQYRMAGKLIDGAACFTLHRDTLAEASFAKPGAKLAQTLQNTLRRQLQEAMEPLVDRVRCYRDRSDGGGLVAKTTLDGVAHPELDRPVLWVAPNAGWKVG